MDITVLSEDPEVMRLLAKGQIVQSVLANNPEPMSSVLGTTGFQRRVALSLADTTFIDSSGLGWLLGCNKRFRESGGALVIHSVPPIVQDVIRVMRLDRVLKIADDEKAAVALAGGPNP